MIKDLKYSSLWYKFMFQSNYQCKWIKYIKLILGSTGFSDIQLNKATILSKHTHLVVKQTLKDNFLQDWNSQLQNSSKGKQYNLFKDTINREPYLTLIPKHMYIPILIFRTCNHKFPIGVGRYTNRRVPYCDRKRTVCTTNDLGDEFHYLLVCPFFNSKRKQYILRYYYTNPNVLKYRELLNEVSVSILENLSMFIKLLFKQFKKINV